MILSKKKSNISRIDVVKRTNSMLNQNNSSSKNEKQNWNVLQFEK